MTTDNRMTYHLETLDRQGRVTHEGITDTLKHCVLGPWTPLPDGGEQATGWMPAYLGGKRVGRTRVRVTR